MNPTNYIFNGEAYKISILKNSLNGDKPYLITNFDNNISLFLENYFNKYYD